MIDADTRAYLDEGWTVTIQPPAPHQSWSRRLAILGSDGEVILWLNLCQNAAHFLTPEAMAQYLMELHDEHVAEKMQRIRGGGK